MQRERVKQEGRKGLPYDAAGPPPSEAFEQPRPGE
jgi:hypothetical protein